MLPRCSAVGCPKDATHLTAEEHDKEVEWRLACADHVEKWSAQAFLVLTNVGWKSQERIREFFSARGFKHVDFAEDHDRAMTHAMGVLERDYQEDVNGIADELEKAVLSREIEDLDGLMDRLSQSVDGTQRVIYTHEAEKGLLVSRNAGYGVDEGLISPEDFKSGIPWEKLMFCAMEEDVREELAHRKKIDMREDNLGMPDKERAGSIVAGTDMCSECVDEQGIKPENATDITPGAEFTCTACCILFEVPEN